MFFLRLTAKGAIFFPITIVVCVFNFHIALKHNVLLTSAQSGAPD